MFYDVNQSNIYFSGPHPFPIFTTVYRAAGFTANHMDIMFSELAQAYLDSPWTYMHADVDDPPLEFAQELNLVEELISYLNSPKQLNLLLNTPDSSILDSPIINILPLLELIPALPLMAL